MLKFNKHNKINYYRILLAEAPSSIRHEWSVCERERAPGTEAHLPLYDISEMEFLLSCHLSDYILFDGMATTIAQSWIHHIAFFFSVSLSIYSRLSFHFPFYLPFRRLKPTSNIQFTLMKLRLKLSTFFNRKKSLGKVDDNVVFLKTIPSSDVFSLYAAKMRSVIVFLRCVIFVS